MTDASPPSAGRLSTRPHFGWLLRVGVTVLSVITLLAMGLEWQIKHRADVGIAANHVNALVARTPAPPLTTRMTTATGPTTGAAATARALIAASSPAAPTTRASSATTYQAENILLLGSDTRSGGNAVVGSDPSTNGVANSDVVMIAHISADRQHVTVLSIPRDTMVPAPTTCHFWNSTTGVVSKEIYQPSPGERFHFNSGYSVGGPQCTVTEVQNLTGLQIDRFIGIDFVGFQAMVDALNGVTVDICSPVVDTVLGTVVPRAGVQRINGGQALNLVRARDVIGDNLSDLARIRRQQIVLSALLRQVTTAGTLLNPAKLDNFLQAFVKNTVTDNVTVDDLVTLAGSLGNLSPGIVNFYTLPTYPSTITDGALEVDTAAAPPILIAMAQDRPVSPTSSTTTGTTSPAATAPVGSPPVGSPPGSTRGAPATSAPGIPQFSLAFPTTPASSASLAGSAGSAGSRPPAAGSTSAGQAVNAATAQCAGPGNE